MNKFSIGLVALLLGLSRLLLAQPVNKYVGDVVMPSPTAASLGKYGDIPVSYYTGVPSVGIPIYTLTNGPLKLPISLSYHAGGDESRRTGELGRPGLEFAGRGDDQPNCSGKT